MAQNPLLNELIEERFYPIVDSIKGFFGSFGTGSGQPSPSPPIANGSTPTASPLRFQTSSGSAAGSARTGSGGSTPFRSVSSVDSSASLSSPSKLPTTSPSGAPLPSTLSGSQGIGGNGSTASPARAKNPLLQSTYSIDGGSCTAAGGANVTGNQRVSAVRNSGQPPTRTGSYHGDLCRSTAAARARLTESPLRATSIDSPGNGSGKGSDTSSPIKGGSNQQQTSTNFLYGSISSQFRQTFAELSGGSNSNQQNGGTSSVDDPDADCPPTPGRGGGANCSVSSADDDSGDGYSAALAASNAAEKLGRIQFSVSYDFDAQTLTIKIMRAESLAAKDLSGTSDPYVKISLLPDKKHTLTTNIKRKNLNPRWNEVFAFEGFPYNKVVTKTLHLLVLDYDRFSRDDPIGEVCLPLGDLDLATGQTMWKTLMPCKGAVGKLGVLQLSLCYQPADESIIIVIMKARDLKAKDINGLSDPYVKIWLMHDGKRIEKKKTAVKEKTLNPIFDETFLFIVPYERIRQTSLIISVMDYDRMGRNEAIGQLVLGPKSGPIEMKHWNEMFAKTRQPVTQWHLLKDFG